MQDFQFLVTDDRFADPALMFVQTRDQASARRLAAQLLANENYHVVEVWDGEARLFTISDADPLAA